MTYATDRPDAAGHFDQEVVAAVCRHLNDDHRDDLLALARVLGGATKATEATAVRVDAHGLDLDVAGPGGNGTVHVAFPSPVAERAGLRTVLAELTRAVRRGQAASREQPGFAAELRAATAPDHARSEEAPFLDGLLGGQLGIEAFHALALQHRKIYEALEAGADRLAMDPVIAPFLVPELSRRDALVGDLQWLTAADPGPEPPVLAATERYAERIHEVAASWPAGFVAHHYTRYLGDLSGGMHIGRVLHRRFAGGTDFYRFDGIGDVRGFKQRYRRLLDAAPWDAVEQRRVVDEVVSAYDLNRQVFAALADLVAEGGAKPSHGAEVRA